MDECEDDIYKILGNPSGVMLDYRPYDVPSSEVTHKQCTGCGATVNLLKNNQCEYCRRYV